MIREDWLSGFIDGEGTFVIGISKSKSHKTGYNILPLFSIELSCIDKPILDEIERYFGVGRVREIKMYEHYKRAGIRKNMHYRYEVWGRYCNTIRTFLESNFMITSKADSFRLWCEALDIINQKGLPNLTKEDVLSIATIRDKMNCGRKRSKKYRNYERMKELLYPPSEGKLSEF